MGGRRALKSGTRSCTVGPILDQRQPHHLGRKFAIRRFLRPVCYQDLPAALLPEALREGNPLNLWRRVDGVLSSK